MVAIQKIFTVARKMAGTAHLKVNRLLQEIDMFNLKIRNIALNEIILYNKIMVLEHGIIDVQ